MIYQYYSNLSIFSKYYLNVVGHSQCWQKSDCPDTAKNASSTFHVRMERWSQGEADSSVPFEGERHHCHHGYVGGVFADGCE